MRYQTIYFLSFFVLMSSGLYAAASPEVGLNSNLSQQVENMSKQSGSSYEEGEDGVSACAYACLAPYKKHLPSCEGVPKTLACLDRCMGIGQDSISFCLQPGNETTEACKAVSFAIGALRYYQSNKCRRQ